MGQSGEIYVDRQEALATVEGYRSEAMELKEICGLVASAATRLADSWEGRAAASAQGMFEEAEECLTTAQDKLLKHSGYVKRGADTFEDVDKALVYANQPETPVCGEISRYIR